MFSITVSLCNVTTQKIFLFFLVMLFRNVGVRDNIPNEQSFFSPGNHRGISNVEKSEATLVTYSFVLANVIVPF